eukprot:scaffold8178_cov296-Pinguiococcus_pyrenoidosus.AAC.9
MMAPPKNVRRSAASGPTPRNSRTLAMLKEGDLLMRCASCSEMRKNVNGALGSRRRPFGAAVAPPFGAPARSVASTMALHFLASNTHSAAASTASLATRDVSSWKDKSGIRRQDT